MDSGEGKFIQTAKIEDLEAMRDQYPKSKGVFTVGVKLEIKGSKFLVKDISPFGIKLKRLAQD